MAFTTIEEVEIWAEDNGGANGLRVALADGRFGANQRSIQLSNEWLRRHDDAAMQVRQARALEATAQSVDEARRAAQATEKAANWTRVAAIFTAVGAAATLVGATATFWQTWLVREQMATVTNHSLAPTTNQAPLVEPKSAEPSK